MIWPVANPVEPDPIGVLDPGLPIADSPSGPAYRRKPCDPTRRRAWPRPSPGPWAGSVGTPPPAWTGCRRQGSRTSS